MVILRQHQRLKKLTKQRLARASCAAGGGGAAPSAAVPRPAATAPQATRTAPSVAVSRGLPRRSTASELATHAATALRKIKTTM